MNKAKMTFRFDSGRQYSKRETKPEPQVIPLDSAEYQVVGESVEHAEESREIFTLGDNRSTAAKPVEPVLIDAQTLNSYTTDYGGWQTSFDTETQRVEQIIRSTSGSAVDPESGYYEREDQQKHLNRRDWQGQQVHPDRRERHERQEYPDRKGSQDFGDQEDSVRAEELRDHRWYAPPQESSYIKRSSDNGSWLKITTSVTGAVVTGVAFGFLVLSMFSGDDEASKIKPGGADAAVRQVQGVVKQGDAGNQPADAGTKAPADATAVSGSISGAGATTAGVAVNLPAKSYTFLQGGVFSSAQSAETESANFKKKGLAGVYDSGDKFPVYVGMATNRDEALGLSAQFQQKKIEVLLKPYDIPSVTKVKWNGKQADVLQNYMGQGDKLVSLIASLSVSSLGNAKPAAIDEKALQTIKTTHQSWSGSASAVSDGLGDPGKSILPKMNSALNQAVVSLDEYKKNPSAAYMWQAQSSLMQYIVAEKELLKAVAAQ
ncbi:hypothetical protein ACFQI7_20960 [Paenibacillus allorhizosphaerae]|uniref:SPOR domain-containing protein n=1 Tax=Paenibacillus allorhizosphaerae TaxID=2849866 RepID=A0ABN7TTM4_9BACL|nr:hypothetical protein [Paenibacillus allorhizosphaerae]CAG7655353.1 hypothetical protein PAECIP111802_06088 [Paenibacillus allorhizosphaerae]